MERYFDCSCDCTDCAVADCEFVKDAVSKQIPKKSRDIIYFGEAGYYVGLCPCCNRGNNSEHQYCYGCGQKLDW